MVIHIVYQKNQDYQDGKNQAKKHFCNYRFACNRPDDGAIPQLPADTVLMPGESVYLIRNGLDIEPLPLCMPGTVLSANNSSCESCLVGTFQPLSGQEACIPCEAGRYQDEEGQAVCKICPEGTYQPDRGQIGCLTCPPGFTSLEGSIICAIPIPTLSQWSLIILVFCLFIFGVIFITKRKLNLV